MMPKVVFMGSPEFSIPVLQRLSENYSVVGVVTQPDRLSGRGRVLTPPPIKVLANQLKIPVIQPEKLRQPGVIQQLIQWAPQVIVVAAFGQILRTEVLDLPEHGCINVHASLLPRWRGAAPIQAAIISGDNLTGITIMKMDPGVDTGPILCQEAIPIAPQDTSTSLGAKLSMLGAELLLKTIPVYLSGDLQPRPQDDSIATYAPMVTKEDGLLDFNQTAVHLERKIRAFNPWPGTYTLWRNQVLKIHAAHIVAQDSIQPGRFTVYQGLPAITTRDGLLVIDLLQPAGKTIQSGKTFLQGARDWDEEVA